MSCSVAGGSDPAGSALPALPARFLGPRPEDRPSGDADHSEVTIHKRCFWVLAVPAGKARFEGQCR